MTQQQKPQLRPEFIDRNAYSIVSGLQKEGFTTYLVGGCVRDLLLGIEPKDYDIATTAKPNEVRRAISQAYIIGKRFRLVLVKRGHQQFEVATFRREHSAEDEAAAPEEALVGDNLFGTPEQDAKRRDFTINGMFYDPIKNETIDYSEGLKDLRAGVVKMIGDPTNRLIEDPIRIMRALRLTHLIRFRLDSDLRAAIASRAQDLATSVLPRRREEILKFLRLDEPHLVLLDCFDLGVLKHISPTLHKILDTEGQHEEFLNHLLNFHNIFLNRDNPVELYAVILLAVVRTVIAKDPREQVRSKEILEHPVIAKFMKDELGMFNHEQSLVTKALQLEGLLAKPDDILRKGERRQNSLFAMEAFPLAMQIAKREFIFSGEDFLYWSSRYRSFNANRPVDEINNVFKKRKRRFKKKRGPKPATEGV